MSAFSDAFHTPQAHGPESPSTYFVQDRHNKEDILRLITQNRLFTTAMGGVLVEQADPTRFQDVLDIGSGIGGWAIAAAQAYPTMSVLGIDISQSMVDYANVQAKAQGVAERVIFQARDALTLPGLKNSSFDLVNLGFGAAYLRVWEWPQIMREIIRVTRPGGTIRLTAVEILPTSNSAALQKIFTLLLVALQRSNHLFDQDGAGIASHLETFLVDQKCQQIQTQKYIIEYRADTTTCNDFYNSVQYLFRNSRPFLQKWVGTGKDYDTLYKQVLADMQQPTFQATSNFRTVWGQTPG